MSAKVFLGAWAGKLRVSHQDEFNSKLAVVRVQALQGRAYCRAGEKEKEHMRTLAANEKIDTY